MTRRLPFQKLLHRGVEESTTPLPGLFHFTLDPYLIMLSVKQAGSSTIFGVFGMTRSGIEPRRPGVVIYRKKENGPNSGLCHPGRPQSENQRKLKERELRKRTKKVMEDGSDGDINYNERTQNGPQRFGKRSCRAGNQRTCRDHPNHNITKISQNTEKNLGDLKRLAVTQAPVKDHQLILVWKTRKE